MEINTHSKIPQSFSELKKDKTFAKLLQVCRKDNRFFSDNKRYSEHNSETDTIFLLPYRAQLAYLIFAVLQTNYLRWDLENFILPLIKVSVNLYPIMRGTAFVISILVCLINIVFEWKKNTIISVLNISIIIATWYLIMHDAPYFESFALSTAIQIILTVIHSFMLQIIAHKELKKWKILGLENHKLNTEDEKFYNETIKEIEENWGIASSCAWWGNNKFTDSLAEGENFLKNHEYVYTLQNVKKYDYYNNLEKSQVKGTQTDKYKKHYTKTYIIHKLPDDLRKNIQKNIILKNFKPLYPVDIDSAFLENGRLFAIECKCRADYYAEHRYEGVNSSSPAQSDIDAARTRINQRYDDRERLHNLIESGRDYTNEQMINIKGLTQELWTESEISKNLRQRDINNYISDNTKVNNESYGSSRNNSKTYSEILMYIVNDYIFYNPSPNAYQKEEKYIWADPGFELDTIQSKNHYDSYSDTVEAATYYLMKSDSEFAHHTIERLWRDNTKMVSRIMHTYAQLRGKECIGEEA